MEKLRCLGYILLLKRRGVEETRLKTRLEVFEVSYLPMEIDQPCPERSGQNTGGWEQMYVWAHFTQNCLPIVGIVFKVQTPWYLLCCNSRLMYWWISLTGNLRTNLFPLQGSHQKTSFFPLIFANNGHVKMFSGCRLTSEYGARRSNTDWAQMPGLWGLCM